MWVRNRDGCGSDNSNTKMSIMWRIDVYDVLHRSPWGGVDEQSFTIRRDGRLI